MRLTDRIWKLTASGAFAVALALVATPAQAAYYSGTFGVQGTGVLSFQTGGFGFIDFCPADTTSPGSGSANVCSGQTSGTGTGTAIVGSTSDDYNGVLSPLTSATILDVTNTPGGSGNFSYLGVAPPDALTALANFITFASAPNLSVVATHIINQTCVPSLSEVCVNGFKLTQNTGSVSVSILIGGYVLDSNDGAQSGITSGLFTGNFSNPLFDTIPEVLAAAGPNGIGAFSPSWSATITTVVPEPATYALIGGALLGLGLLRRKVA